MDICFVFLYLACLTISGVFGDEVKSVSVMEGESVTLHTDVVKQRDDKIMWYYGPGNTFVARMNGKDINTLYSDEERFKDRVNLDDQTGDLTITNITSNHTGLYTLKISKNKRNSFKTFNVTVYGNSSISLPLDGSITKQNPHLNTEDFSSDSPALWIIILVVFALLICVIFIIVCIHRKMCRKASVLETVYTLVADKGSSMSSSSSSGDSNSSKLTNDLEKNRSTD